MLGIKCLTSSRLLRLYYDLPPLFLVVVFVRFLLALLWELIYFPPKVTAPDAKLRPSELEILEFLIKILLMRTVSPN